MVGITTNFAYWALCKEQHKAQLERDLIAERVRNGLANAIAKGVHVGRHKMRDSDLIRKLLASKGMTYREAARIAKCSTGAISAEVRAMKVEALALEKNKALEEALLPKLEVSHSRNTDSLVTNNAYQGQNFNFVSQDTSLEFER